MLNHNQMRLKAHCTIKRKPLIRKEPEENYIHKPFLHNVKTSFVKNYSCSYVNFDWREAHLVCLPLIKTQCWTVVSTRACNSRASPGKMAACHGNQFQCFAEAFSVFPWQHHPAENICGISVMHFNQRNINTVLHSSMAVGQSALYPHSLWQ